MHEMIDAFVSAQNVRTGRPSPYMVHRLMEQTGVLDCKQVAKFGDTQRDMEEGTNAGCGQVVGVLSGADSRETLVASGATDIVGNITELALPERIDLQVSPAQSSCLEWEWEWEWANRPSDV